MAVNTVVTIHYSTNRTLGCSQQCGHHASNGATGADTTWLFWAHRSGELDGDGGGHARVLAARAAVTWSHRQRVQRVWTSGIHGGGLHRVQVCCGGIFRLSEVSRTFWLSEVRGIFGLSEVRSIFRLSEVRKIFRLSQVRGIFGLSEVRRTFG